MFPLFYSSLYICMGLFNNIELRRRYPLVKHSIYIEYSIHPDIYIYEIRRLPEREVYEEGNVLSYILFQRKGRKPINTSPYLCFLCKETLLKGIWIPKQMLALRESERERERVGRYLSRSLERSREKWRGRILYSIDRLILLWLLCGIKGYLGTVVVYIIYNINMNIPFISTPTDHYNYSIR